MAAQAPNDAERGLKQSSMETGAPDDSQLLACNLFRVDGLVAVITGGGSGLGRFMARALVLNGAERVFIIGRREETLKKTAATVPEGKIVPLQGDVSKKEDLARCAAKVKEDVGLVNNAGSWVDVLVANSGVPGPMVKLVDGNGPRPLDEIAKNLWETSFDETVASHGINVTSTQYLVAAFLPLMDAANKQRPQPPTQANFMPRPQIITTASVAAWSRLPMGNLSYGPSKAALVQMTKALASVLAPHQIRANCIAPGMYISEMTDGWMSRDSTIEGGCPYALSPATRCGDEIDMAGVILGLTSRAGAFTNGCVYITDGGKMANVPGSY